MAHVSGEIGKEEGVLVIERIHVRYDLKTEGDRTTVERVHGVHARACPVARSIGGCVKITTEIAYR